MGSALEDACRSCRVVDEIHHVRSSPVGTNGKAPADDLPEAGQIGLDSDEILQTPLGTAESHDFVEDQQDTKLLGDLPHPTHEFRSDRYDSGLRVEHDTRQLIAVA